MVAAGKRVPDRFVPHAAARVISLSLAGPTQRGQKEEIHGVAPDSCTAAQAAAAMCCPCVGSSRHVTLVGTQVSSEFKEQLSSLMAGAPAGVDGRIV